MLAQADVFRLPLSDQSVDLIFTDPPYSLDSVSLYGDIAREAVRILRPKSFVLFWCGGAHLNRIIREIEKSGLLFFWKYEVVLGGPSKGVVWPYGNTQVPILVRSQPILAYSKDKALPRTGTISVFGSNGADKRFHHWGKDVASARYFIDCFSAEGDLICDPMIGGGTTAIACQLIGRRFIGFDLDWEACTTSDDRMKNSDAVMNLPLFASVL